jgi:type I restriction enzyme S subunit
VVVAIQGGFELMSWEKVKLDRFFIVKKGQAITKKESNPGIYPVILGGREPAYYIDKYNHTGKAIVVSRSGASAGYVSFWNESIFITDGFLIEPKDDVVYIFVYYLLKYKQSQLIGNQRGAAIPHVTPNLLYSVEAFCPPLTTQQKIADILSAYDNLIENNQKQIKLLEEAAQRLYKQWFIDLRFPGHETTKIVEGLPEGWKKERADSFFNITIGKTPPRAEKQWFVEGGCGVSWISISDMGTDSAFIFETAENLTSEAIMRHNVKVVPPNTVLLSFKLTVGRVSITTSNMCTNEAIAHFVTEDNLLREYTYCYLKNFHYDELGSTSSISKAINSKIVKAMPFVMPSDDALKAFHKVMKPIFDQIFTKQKQIQNLSQSRDRLLPKLMNGELEI